MNAVFKIVNIHQIDSPAIAVYPAIIKKNIESALREGDIGSRKGLRPHVKTCKTLEIVKMMMDQGISKFKCSTIAEGEMLGMAGAADVLIAYQPSSVKAERILALRNRFPETDYSCLIDNRLTADMLSQKCMDHPLPVYIDINVGMNRTGISPGEVPGLIDYCSGLKGIQIKGIQAYDGHIHEKDPLLRKGMTDEIYDRVKEIQQAVLKQQGIRLNLIFGGSPGFSMYAQKEDVECSPGTFVFWDAGYAANFPDLPFVVAALVITRIVSIVDGHRLCLDLGHKAIGSENPLPRVVFPDIPDVKVVSHSEEHMVVEVPDTAKYRVEDVWYGIPVHICPTIALHQSLCVIENNQYTSDWEIIARNRKITI